MLTGQRSYPDNDDQYESIVNSQIVSSMFNVFQHDQYDDSTYYVYLVLVAATAVVLVIHVTIYLFVHVYFYISGYQEEIGREEAGMDECTFFLTSHWSYQYVPICWNIPSG